MANHVRAANVRQGLSNETSQVMLSRGLSLACTLVCPSACTYLWLTFRRALTTLSARSAPLWTQVYGNIYVGA